ncbi:hypothetical protein HOT12_gp35 [Burkholderia phage vB_BmuP_KL4]|uniref:Uncharacterized protein n=1 Tax=Burkholderia phage vB_BmuP_KL4 TaxID=2115967 RepID=A0A2S1GN78_9CAUD|nr:hypothetical protein HOT12_gp35 [Burkholderia phage vB_BmuP_KL4]AWD90839.1 hypothetical protein [Burkholderia phage vB_BmuP_KL4]
MNDRQCTAYRPGSLCRNGFPPNAACMGATCHACGRSADVVPVCMRDEVPPHLIDEAGRMKFADAARAGDAS